MVNFPLDPPIAPMLLESRILTLGEYKLSVNTKLKRLCFMCSRVSCHQHIITTLRKKLKYIGFCCRYQDLLVQELLIMSKSWPLLYLEEK